MNNTDPVKNCEWCGKKFKKRKGKYRESLKKFWRRRFCSIPCRLKWQKDWYTNDNPVKYYDNSGKNNPMYGKRGWNYNPEGNRRKDGYWRVTIDKGRVLKHRHLVEKELGRKLRKEEVVHHIDGNPSNNRLENLKLFNSHSEHVKYESSNRNKI